MLKRIFDFVVSATVLLALAPVFFFVAILIRGDSHGPVLFFHDRVGRDSKPFRLWKFRTMYVNSESLPITVGSHDPRVTRIGYFLRKWKIDELPQLVNVLRGEMSLVGPRPEVREFVDMYDAEQREILTVRPGITDPASIEFRHENELLGGQKDPLDYYSRVVMPQKLRLSLEYVRTQSFLGDLRIVLKTLLRVLGG